MAIQAGDACAWKGVLMAHGLLNGRNNPCQSLRVVTLLTFNAAAEAFRVNGGSRFHRQVRPFTRPRCIWQRNLHGLGQLSVDSTRPKLNQSCSAAYIRL